MSAPPPRDRNGFKIAIICALPLEADAAIALFDEFWEDANYGKAEGDTNAYTLGRIGRHDVVLAHMQGMGKVNASNVATCFRFSFPNIELGFLVGICGGVPVIKGKETEIVLGDIIISTGIVQYDFGRRFDDKFSRKDTLESNLGRPNTEIGSFLAKLEGDRSRQRLLEDTTSVLASPSDKPGFKVVQYPGADEDRLHEPTHRHKHQDSRICVICAKCQRREDEVCAIALGLDCVELGCDKNKQIARRRLLQTVEAHIGFGVSNTMVQYRTDALKPLIHFGLMASGDTVMKSGEERDRIASQEGVIAFEMEGAGVWDNFPCIVIKGVCDYADSHKNKNWQSYAASTAAACMKAFINEWTSLGKRSHVLESTSLSAKRTKLDESATTKIVRSHPQETKLACLRTLSYFSIDDRKHNISLAHQDTCNWIFETPIFQQWWKQDDLLDHNGVLWMKGKPGAGKSTLMKHTLSYCDKNFGGIIAAHFFSARGNKLEKTMMGMLRSLLYQLLDRDPILCELFIPMYLDKEKKHGNQWEWTPGELQNFIRLELKKSRVKRLLLIDALDECDDLEAGKVVEFLEDLSIFAVDSQIDLHIYLSSRHYPTIDMEKRLEMKLENQKEHNQDIMTYIQNKLKTKDPMIEQELLRKAESVFLWVVLVVEMLNKAFHQGKTKAVRKKLQEVPKDLDGIFFDILQKESPDKEATLLMLQWMLFSQSILRPEELYFAVMAGIEPEELGPWDKESQNSGEIERYITNISKGLIEIRKGVGQNNVQFIHKSVNDFLLRNRRLQTLHPALQQYPIGFSHDRLKSCCMHYIGMLDDFYTDREKILEPRDDAQKFLSDHFPFVEYVVAHVLTHAEMAHSGGISQQAYMQRLESGEFQRLKRFKNIFTNWNQNKDYTDELIYATSVECHYELSKIILSYNSVTVNVQGGQYGTALQAASYEGSKEVVELLIEKGADVNLQGGTYGTALQAASVYGSKEVVELLIKKGADVNLQGGIYGTALQAASWQGDIRVVKLLIEKGADINLQGGRYGTALQAASSFGHKEVVELLIEKGAEVNTPDGLHGSALAAALYGEHEEIAALLRQHGAIDQEFSETDYSSDADSFDEKSRLIRRFR